MDDALNTLSREIGHGLMTRGWTLATAESCTGGWISQVVTATAGSSAWFDRGFVTYSNAAKQQMLGVKADTLARHGAVSEATVREMATGALAHSDAQVAISVSGIAGPGGASPDKPIGTICFAWAFPGGRIESETTRFDGDRESIRRQAVVHALATAIRRIASPGAA